MFIVATSLIRNAWLKPIQKNILNVQSSVFKTIQWTQWYMWFKRLMFFTFYFWCLSFGINRLKFTCNPFSRVCSFVHFAFVFWLMALQSDRRKQFWKKVLHEIQKRKRMGKASAWQPGRHFYFFLHWCRVGETKWMMMKLIKRFLLAFNRTTPSIMQIKKMKNIANHNIIRLRIFLLVRNFFSFHIMASMKNIFNNTTFIFPQVIYVLHRWRGAKISYFFFIGVEPLVTFC